MREIKDLFVTKKLIRKKCFKMNMFLKNVERDNGNQGFAFEKKIDNVRILR